jgi:hypothetical protein
VTERVLARQGGQRRRLQDVFARAPVAVCVFGRNYVLGIVNRR